MTKYKFTLENLNKNHWVEVKIYKTRAGYRKARVNCFRNSNTRVKNKKAVEKIKTSAFTFIATKPRGDGKVGEIYFNLQDFYAGIITHELTHLAIWYWKLILKKKLNDINRLDNEEKFADLCGVIMQNFNDEVLIHECN